MKQSPDMMYLGRNRLHRSRANLIQTLNTVAAFTENGQSVCLYLPPWPVRKLSLQTKLDDLFIPTKINVVRSQLLHPRWNFWPFVRLNVRTLRAAKYLYTRSPEISIALGNVNLVHSLEIHDFVDLQKKKQLSSILEMHANKTISQLISITESTRDMLVHAGADSSRIHVATSGVNLHAFKSVSEFDPSSLDRPHLVYIGRMSQEYGRSIFQAIAETKQYKITIVGGSEEDKASNIDVAPFAPYHEVVRWYDRMSIALMPYQSTLKRIETLSPMKLFEAFGAGRPIIASDLPVIREVVKHKENGLLVDPSDPKAWLEAIRQLQNDRELAQKLAHNAKMSAEKYSWKNRAQGIMKAIKSTVNC